MLSRHTGATESLSTEIFAPGVEIYTYHAEEKGFTKYFLIDDVIEMIVLESEDSNVKTERYKAVTNRYYTVKLFFMKGYTSNSIIKDEAEAFIIIKCDPTWEDSNYLEAINKIKSSGDDPEFDFDIATIDLLCVSDHGIEKRISVKKEILNNSVVNIAHIIDYVDGNASDEVRHIDILDGREVIEYGLNLSEGYDYKVDEDTKELIIVDKTNNTERPVSPSDYGYYKHNIITDPDEYDDELEFADDAVSNGDFDTIEEAQEYFIENYLE